MKHQKTTHNHEYIVKYYRLDYYYPKEKFDHYYQRHTIKYTVHSGCVTLLWELKFNSLAKLREYLKQSYSKDHGLHAYTNINHIIKGQRDLTKDRFLVISCPTKTQSDSLYITLKEPKKKNRFPKKRKGFYYDDMYNSGDTGIRDIIIERDHSRYHQY